MCPDCDKGFLVEYPNPNDESKYYICSNTTCSFKNAKCPGCNDGYLMREVEDIPTSLAAVIIPHADTQDHISTTMKNHTRIVFRLSYKLKGITDTLKSSAKNVGPPYPFTIHQFHKNKRTACSYAHDRSIEGENSIRIIIFTLLSLTICAHYNFLQLHGDLSLPFPLYLQRKFASSS